MNETLHWSGLEPLTARFVAGYSIQLSYQCRKQRRRNGNSA
jgi:hypothetical protein